MLPTNLQTLAQALHGEVSGGEVRAPGPGHSPQDRSMSVKLDPSAPEGFIVHSFSTGNPIACRDHVRKMVGLPAFKPNGKRHTSDEVEKMLVAAVNAQSRIEKPKGTIVAQYDYKDADGTLVFQVLRYEPKSFRQRRPDGKGWIWKLDDIKRVPYRLPEILKYPDAMRIECRCSPPFM